MHACSICTSPYGNHNQPNPTSEMTVLPLAPLILLGAFDPLQPRALPRSVRVHNLWDQCIPYADALAWQRELLSERVAASRSGGVEQEDVLIMLQHPPVLTLGTSSTLDNVISPDAPPFELVRTERGGEVTYHGPGQVVLYPILDLREHRQDIHWYMRALEEVVIRALGDFGLSATREMGLTGVWVDGAKACAIGVKCSRWVTMHGLALNVATDLSHFGHIVPCGIADKPVTSLAQELQRSGRAPELADAAASRALLDEAQQALLRHFGDVFDVDVLLSSSEESQRSLQLLACEERNTP